MQATGIARKAGLKKQFVSLSVFMILFNTVVEASESFC